MTGWDSSCQPKGVPQQPQYSTYCVTTFNRPSHCAFEISLKQYSKWVYRVNFMLSTSFCEVRATRERDIRGRSVEGCKVRSRFRPFGCPTRSRPATCSSRVIAACAFPNHPEEPPTTLRQSSSRLPSSPMSSPTYISTVPIYNKISARRCQWLEGRDLLPTSPHPSPE
jgi:hypothetical protein